MSKEYTDPICGMSVTPETAAAPIEHNGDTVYFCATGLSPMIASAAMTFSAMLVILNALRLRSLKL